MAKIKMNQFKLALNIGRTARLFDEGKSYSEIASILKQPESTIRWWIEAIKRARANENK